MLFEIKIKIIYFVIQSTFKMKISENYLAEIKEIRKMMEESSRFLSLSGLSGILVGVYALAGAFAAHQILSASNPALKLFNGDETVQLTVLAVIILAVSLITVIALTWNKAKKSGKKIWNPGSRLMLLNLAIPLISGGMLVLIFLYNGNFEFVAGGCLLFYGLALINAAKFTRQEIFYMGLIQTTLGVLAALFPNVGLLLWAFGFGVIHIVYGAVMYFRYEYKSDK